MVWGLEVWGFGFNSFGLSSSGLGLQGWNERGPLKRMTYGCVLEVCVWDGASAWSPLKRIRTQ